LKTISCLEYSVYCDDITSEKLLGPRKVINTINPHCYCIAKKDSFYRLALQSSDILLPDGIGIIWAVKTLTGLRIQRITGSDLHIKLLIQVNRKLGKVFYMGSTNIVLKKIHERVNTEYPGIKIGTYSPPFKPIFSTQENEILLDAINQFHPDVLFVGMTAPKQEKWVFENKHLLNATVICSIGAVFDFYAGEVKRPGKFWISIGLEWLPRLLREPHRLWRRTFISTPLFICYVLLLRLHVWLNKSKIQDSNSETLRS